MHKNVECNLYFYFSLAQMSDGRYARAHSSLGFALLGRKKTIWRGTSTLSTIDKGIFPIYFHIIDDDMIINNEESMLRSSGLFWFNIRFYLRQAKFVYNN